MAHLEMMKTIADSQWGAPRGMQSNCVDNGKGAD